jgi:hypothetical protein
MNTISPKDFTELLSALYMRGEIPGSTFVILTTLFEQVILENRNRNNGIIVSGLPLSMLQSAIDSLESLDLGWVLDTMLFNEITDPFSCPAYVFNSTPIDRFGTTFVTFDDITSTYAIDDILTNMKSDFALTWGHEHADLVSSVSAGTIKATVESILSIFSPIPQHQLDIINNHKLAINSTLTLSKSVNTVAIIPSEVTGSPLEPNMNQLNVANTADDSLNSKLLLMPPIIQNNILPWNIVLSIILIIAIACLVFGIIQNRKMNKYRNAINPTNVFEAYT